LPDNSFKHAKFDYFYSMNSTPEKSIFLAEDDIDDRILFEEALREVSLKTQLTIAKDGQHLIHILDQRVPPPPDMIFIDLNMPRKNGFECLEEIKQTPKLKDIPIIIFSTSAQPEAVNKVYEQGANYFIRKPNTFHLLKKTLQKVLAINWKENYKQPSKENFILHP